MVVRIKCFFDRCLCLLESQDCILMWLGARTDVFIVRWYFHIAIYIITAKNTMKYWDDYKCVLPTSALYHWSKSAYMHTALSSTWETGYFHTSGYGGNYRIQYRNFHLSYSCYCDKRHMTCLKPYDGCWVSKSVSAVRMHSNFTLTFKYLLSTITLPPTNWQFPFISVDSSNRNKNVHSYIDWTKTMNDFLMLLINENTKCFLFSFYSLKV